MQTILGIDLGTYSVKVAEIQRSFKNFAFTGFFERRVQYNDVLTPEESQVAALQAILEDHALTWDTCYLAFPGQHVASRLIVLPFSKTSRIEQALPFEIEEHMPFDLEDIVHDYYILQSEKEFSRLLAFYTQKNDVGTILGLASHAGVEPRRLCVAGVELVNLVAMGLVPPEAPFAIVDVGHQQTVVTICEHGHFAMTRTISLGGATMTQAIAQVLGVGNEEAEQLKIEIGAAVAHGDMPPEDTVPFKVIHAIDEVLQELLRELKQTFFAYRQQSDATVQGVFLCGGAARLGGLDDYLSVHMQQNVTPIDCHNFAFTRLDRSQCQPEVAATALAVALRGVAPGGLAGIDFRKDEFIYRADTEQVSGKIRRFMAAGIFLGLLATGWFGYRWHMLTDQAAQVERDLTDVVVKALPKSAKKVSDPDEALRMLSSSTKQAKERLATLETLLAPSALNTLRRFSQSVPGADQVEMDVDKFEYTPARTQVKVMASTSPDVDKIRKSLESKLSTKDPKAKAAPDGGEVMAVSFGNPKEVKSGGKDSVLTFQVTLEPKSAVDAKNSKKKGKRRRRQRG